MAPSAIGVVHGNRKRKRAIHLPLNSRVKTSANAVLKIRMSANDPNVKTNEFSSAVQNVPLCRSALKF